MPLLVLITLARAMKKYIREDYSKYLAKGQAEIMTYRKIGDMKVKNDTVAVLDVPQITDKRWQQLAGEYAVENFRKHMEEEPASVDLALEWQRNWLKAM